MARTRSKTAAVFAGDRSVRGYCAATALRARAHAAPTLSGANSFYSAFYRGMNAGKTIASNFSTSFIRSACVSAATGATSDAAGGVRGAISRFKN